MTGFYFLLPTLFTIFVSFLVVRAAAIALMMTGLDRNRAIFQALSAFSGTGFTTREAESVINNPMRRKIISWLMVLGNAGLVTVIITATSSFMSSQGYRLPINVMLLALGVLLIYKLANHKGFIRKWESFIEEKLVRSSDFEEGQAEDLLHLMEGYGLVRTAVKGGSPVEGASLSDCSASGKGLIFLGIERGKAWIPSPGPAEKIESGDRLVVYGPLAELKKFLKEGPRCRQ
ncbi:MAG: TrkA C-terminal domain-containing protein [Thermodesulfovibrionales bacterium]